VKSTQAPQMVVCKFLFSERNKHPEFKAINEKRFNTEFSGIAASMGFAQMLQEGNSVAEMTENLISQPCLISQSCLFFRSRYLPYHKYPMLHSVNF